MLLKFVGTKGRVERPVVAEGWLQAAEVELHEGRLKYTYQQPLRRVQLRSGYFWKFLRLASAQDQQIVEYARAFGPLVATAALSFSNETTIPDAPDGFATVQQNRDSLEVWRQTAQEMLELLKLAAELEECSSGVSEASTSRIRITRQKRMDIAAKVNTWMFASSVHPQLIWEAEHWAVRLRVDNLLGALAVQMMLMISRKAGLALCGYCGGLFETDGKRKVYCGGCGLAAAQSAASKKLYDTKKRARQMYEQGQTVKRIAAALGRRIELVKRWVESAGRKG